MTSPIARLLSYFFAQSTVVLLACALPVACSAGADTVGGSTAISGASSGGAAGTAAAGGSPNASGGDAVETPTSGGVNADSGGGNDGGRTDTHEMGGLTGTHEMGGVAGSGMGGVAGSSGMGGVAGGSEMGGVAGTSGMPGASGGMHLGGATSITSGGMGAASGGTTNQPAITIWIAGDSTVMTYAPGNTSGNNGTSLEGWGQELGPFFNDKVTINNQAVGGRSVAFFMWSVATDGMGAYQCTDNQGTPKFLLSNGNKVDTTQWSRIENGMKSGDFLLIQFGTNDETHTCPRFVNLTDFATDLGFMADTAIAKGVTPIFVTPMGHRSFTGTKFNNTLLPYAQSMKGEAQTKKLEVLDLNLRSGEYYEKVGNTYLATNIFDGGTTHFIKAGAIQMASLIVGEIKAQGGRLATYLK